MALLNEENKSGNGFIAQAGILAAAGILSRIIGLLYRSPLAAVIGDLGLGYYQSAYTYYMLILMISSYSIPAAISKVIAQKLAVGEYKNAHRLFKGALYYALAIGAIASFFLFFCGGLFVEARAIPVLRIFAPTIFIYGLLGVIRGYFQAHQSMVQTSVSQIFEQIVNASVSVGAAVVLIRLTMGTMEIPADTEGQVVRAVRGAMGSALGTGSGVVAALLMMLVFYYKSRPEIMERVKADTHTELDSYMDIIKSITFIVTPFILSTAICNICTPINTKIYTDIYPIAKNLDMVDITTRWGIFSGKSFTISNIPVAFSSAMAAAMIPSISQLMASGSHKDCREKIGLAVKTTMLISIPCAVGIFVYSEPITILLFPGTSDIHLASYTLKALAPSIVFYALSTLNSSILQGLGRVKTPIWNAGIALILQTLVTFILLMVTNFDLYAVALANTVYAGAMSILNQIYVRKTVDYRQEMVRTFALPFAAAAVMGASSYVIYLGLRAITHSPRIAVLPAILFAIPVYFVVLIKIKGITEEEMLSIPKGHILVKLAKKCKILK